MDVRSPCVCQLRQSQKKGGRREREEDPEIRAWKSGTRSQGHLATWLVVEVPQLVALAAEAEEAFAPNMAQERREGTKKKMRLRVGLNLGSTEISGPICNQQRNVRQTVQCVCVCPQAAMGENEKTHAERERERERERREKERESQSQPCQSNQG